MLRMAVLAGLAVLLMTSGGAYAIKAGPSNNSGQQGGSSASGDGGSSRLPNRFCISFGAGEEVCFYLEKPKPKYSTGYCCYVRTKKKRMKVFGQMRTVYVDLGRKCMTAHSANQCRALLRRQ